MLSEETTTPPSGEKTMTNLLQKLKRSESDENLSRREILTQQETSMLALATIIPSVLVLGGGVSLA